MHAANNTSLFCLLINFQKVHILSFDDSEDSKGNKHMEGKLKL